FLRDLDDDAFAVREKAKTELARLGAAAEPALRQALAKSPSIEMRRRLEDLLKAVETERQIAFRKAERQAPSRDVLRAVRALEVLEQIGTREAREVLKTLTADVPGAYLTQEARAALDRLEPAGRR